jgi:hypothetical protein
MQGHQDTNEAAVFERALADLAARIQTAEMRLSEHALRESRLLGLIILYAGPGWLAALALFGGYHAWIAPAEEVLLETWLLGGLLAFVGPFL